MMKLIKKSFMFLLALSIFITSIPIVEAKANIHYNKTAGGGDENNAGGGTHDDDDCNGPRKYCGISNTDGIKREYIGTYTKGNGYYIAYPEVTTIAVYNNNDDDIINEDMQIFKDKLPLAGTAVGINIHETKKYVAAIREIQIKVYAHTKVNKKTETKYVCRYKGATYQSLIPQMVGGKITFETLKYPDSDCQDVEYVDSSTSVCPLKRHCESVNKKGLIGIPEKEETEITEIVESDSKQHIKTINLKLVKVDVDNELNYTFTPYITSVKDGDNIDGRIIDEIDYLHIVEVIEHFSYHFFTNLAKNLRLDNYEATYNVSLSNSKNKTESIGESINQSYVNDNAIWTDMHGNIITKAKPAGKDSVGHWKDNYAWVYNSGKVCNGSNDCKSPYSTSKYWNAGIGIPNEDETPFIYEKIGHLKYTKTSDKATGKTQIIDLSGGRYYIGGSDSKAADRPVYGKLYDLREVNYDYQMPGACMDRRNGNVRYTETSNCNSNEIAVSNNEIDGVEHWHYFIPLNAKSDNGITIQMKHATATTPKPVNTCLYYMKQNYVIKKNSLEKPSTEPPYTNIIKPINADFFKGDYICVENCDDADPNKRVFRESSSDLKNIQDNGGCYMSSVVNIPVKQLFYNETTSVSSGNILKGFNFYYQPIDINNTDQTKIIFPNGKPTTSQTLWDEWYDNQKDPSISKANKMLDLSKSFEKVTYVAQNISASKVRDYKNNYAYTSWNNMNINGTSNFIEKEGIVERKTDPSNIYKLGCGPLNSQEFLKDGSKNLLYSEVCKS